MKEFALTLAAIGALALASQAQAAPTTSAAQVTTDSLVLAVTPVNDDLIAGDIATIIAFQGGNNGFLGAATTDLNANLAVYTNGDVDTQPSDLAGLHHDNNGANGNPTISFFYELASGGDTATIDSVAVFSRWQDGRVFYTYDLYTTTDNPPTAGGAWTLVLAGIRPAEYDATHPSPGTQAYGLTVVEDDGSDPLAVGVTGVRLDFYSGGNTLNAFNTPATASEGSWIREIDVVGSIQTGASVSDWNLMQ